MSLTRMGHAGIGLPVVESLFGTECTAEEVGFPNEVVLDFFNDGWQPLWLADASEDEILNAFVVRVLAKPSNREQLNAVHWLLRKKMHVDEAFKAAEGLLKSNASSGTAAAARTTNYILQLLDSVGGERGRALAVRFRE